MTITAEEFGNQLTELINNALVGGLNISIAMGELHFHQTQLEATVNHIRFAQLDAARTAKKAKPKAKRKSKAARA